MAWVFRRTLKGQPSPEIMYGTSSGTVTLGDPVQIVSSSGTPAGTLKKAVYNESNGIVGVAIETKATGLEFAFIPALPDVVFEVPVESGDTPKQFGIYDLNSSLEVNDDAHGTPKVMVVGPGEDGLYTTTCSVVSLGWLKDLAD